MIVKDEEASLGKCLESVQGIVTEMIVMDTGSQDKTCEIAQEYGAKTPSFAWNGNYSDARNAALELVTGDWVLVLDADEVFNREIFPQILPVIAGNKNLVVNFLRQEVGATQSPYSLVSRLFRNHPQIKFSRPYHTLIDDHVNSLLQNEPDWKILEIPEIGIFHYGYTPEMIESLDKANRAKVAMESYFQEHPHDAYVCNKLGALYLQIGQEKEGIKLLKQGLKSGKVDSPTTFELHYHLANAYNRQGKLESAVKHYKKALEQPILPQLKIGAYNNLASLLHSVGELAAAMKIYEKTLQIDPHFVTGYYNLGATLKAQGDFLRAIEAYKKAIALAPDYAPAYQNLGVVWLKVGAVEESKQAFAKAIALHEQQNRPAEARKLRQGLAEMGL
jgi:tetratricopeptide (TPR) repeat protein